MTVNTAKRVNALLTLLQDDDSRIASLAMEELLKLGVAAEKTVAEHQESHDPRLRCRMHQLSSVMLRRKMRQDFIAAIAQERINLWEGVVQINVLYDPRCNTDQIEAVVQDLRDAFADEPITTPRIGSLMRERELRVPEEDILDGDLYLVGRVFETGFGSPAVLCALTKHVAATLDWPMTIVLYNGRFCLIDRNNLLVDPTEGWHIAKLKTDDRIHPCSRKDVLLGILAQMFLVALVDGQLRDLHHLGDLLTALNSDAIDELPYPLGVGAR